MTSGSNPSPALKATRSSGQPCQSPFPRHCSGDPDPPTIAPSASRAYEERAAADSGATSATPHTMFAGGGVASSVL